MDPARYPLMTDEILAASPAATDPAGPGPGGPLTPNLKSKPNLGSHWKSGAKSGANAGLWTVGTYGRLCGMARLQAFRLNQQRRKRLARTHAAEHEERHGEDEAARAKEEVEWTVVDVCAAVWSDVAQQASAVGLRGGPVPLSPRAFAPGLRGPRRTGLSEEGGVTSPFTPVQLRKTARRSEPHVGDSSPPRYQSPAAPTANLNSIRNLKASGQAWRARIGLGVPPAPLAVPARPSVNLFEDISKSSLSRGLF